MNIGIVGAGKIGGTLGTRWARNGHSVRLGSAIPIPRKSANKTVRSLAAELGFDPKDAAPLRLARSLEPFTLLWASLAYGQGYGRNFAFQLLKR